MKRETEKKLLTFLLLFSIAILLIGLVYYLGGDYSNPFIWLGGILGMFYGFWWIEIRKYSLGRIDKLVEAKRSRITIRILGIAQGVCYVMLSPILFLFLLPIDRELGLSFFLLFSISAAYKYGVSMKGSYPKKKSN